MRSTVREHPLLAVFVIAYVVAFTAFGLTAGREGAVVYAVVMTLLVIAIGTAHARVGFSDMVLWGLALWGALHMAGGLVEVDGAVLYHLKPWRWLPRFDQVVHAFGFGVGTVACWQTLHHRLAPTGPQGLYLILVFMGMGVGALNEVVEFAATRIQPSTNVGGYVNTGWDLVANLAGCVIATTAIALHPRSLLADHPVELGHEPGHEQHAEDAQQPA